MSRKKVGRSKKAQRKLTKGSIEPNPQLGKADTSRIDLSGAEGWGQYRLVSSQGHYLVLLAKGQEVARDRWSEFYPNVDVNTVTVTKL